MNSMNSRLEKEITVELIKYVKEDKYKSLHSKPAFKEIYNGFIVRLFFSIA